MRSSIVTGLTLQIAALLLMAGLASAQVPAAGSGARMPTTDQPAAPQGGPPGPPGGGSKRKESPKDIAKREKDAVETAMLLAPMRWFYVEPLPAGPLVEPAYDDHQFFVATKGNKLSAYSVFTGDATWSVADIPAVQQPLAVDSGRLYLIGDGDVQALDTATGKPIWHGVLGGPASTRPIAKAGWLIVALESGELRALRGETGEMVWQQKFEAPIKTVPVIVGDRLYIATQDNHVRALDLVSGQQLWAQEFEAAVSAMAADSHHVLVGTRNTFLALDHAGHVEWKWRVGAEVIGQPVLDDATVYVVLTDNTMRAFALDGGKMRWRTPFDYRPIGGPALHANSLLLVGIAPTLWQYNAKDGKPVGPLNIPTDPRNITAGPPHIAAGNPFFYDTAMIPLAQGSMAGARRNGPGPLMPFIDLGSPCPPLSFPGEPPPPTTASVPAVPPKP